MTDYEFTRCRAFGHSWSEPYIDERADRERRAKLGTFDGHVIAQDCRCGVRRVGFIDLLGNIYNGHWQYHYPEGYRWVSSEPTTRADWRSSFLKASQLKVRRKR